MSKSSNGGGQPSDDFNAEQNDGPGLGELLALWWRNRVRLIVHACAAGAVVIAVLAAVYVLRPTQQESTLVFRLLFKGAEKGQYPNGMVFTPSDIVSTPVLQEVWRRNELEKFGKFDDFKSSFAVINTNPALERLRRDYAGKLEDRRLAAVDRQKLEAEYESRMRAVQSSVFTLVLQREGALSRWPETLAGKIVEDVLNVWAEQSRARGVFKFDLSIFSENLLDEVANTTSDYTLVLDRLRLALNRITENLNALGETPGARLVRVGERQVSLGEMVANLRDNLTFDLRELNAIIYSFGLFRDPLLTEAYLKEQLFRLELERRELQSRNEGMDRVLANYSAARAGGGQQPASGTSTTSGLMPQLSDGFLDRILDLSGQSSDIAFRQDMARQIIANEKEIFQIETDRQIYNRSLEALRKGDVAAAGVNIREVVDERLSGLIARLRVTLQNVSLLHGELSQRNLEPSLIYTVVVPLQQETVSTLSLMKAAMVLVMLAAAYLGLVMVSLARKL